jgi:hypothetical protein
VIDRDDISDLHSAAVAVQEALGLLVERLEVLLPEPEPVPDAERLMAEAPDTEPPEPKLQPLALALPPELLRTIDRFAAQERRSRANMIEIILDDYAQARLAKEAA